MLKYSADGKEHSFRESIQALSNEFDLTDDDRKELLPSGTQAIFDNRVGWAKTYLKKARLIESKKRGYFNITPNGLDLLKQNPEKINVKLLKQFLASLILSSLLKKMNLLIQMSLMKI